MLNKDLVDRYIEARSKLQPYIGRAVIVTYKRWGVRRCRMGTLKSVKIRSNGRIKVQVDVFILPVNCSAVYTLDGNLIMNFE